MSPEQARGDVVDERADVYALGAVLYEVLAGSPPHADATPQAVLDRVIAGPPRPLAMVEQIRPHVMAPRHREPPCFVEHPVHVAGALGRRHRDLRVEQGHAGLGD